MEGFVQADQFVDRAVAGLGAGVWESREELSETWKLDRRFEPKGDRETADAAHRQWRRAVERAKGWAE